MEQEKVQLVSLPVELVNSILAFLADQQFKHVAGLISEIQKKAIPITPEEQEKQE